MGQRRSPLDVAGLELVAARGWRGTEQVPLGEWLLRAGGGSTGRADSARLGLATAVMAALQRWGAGRGARWVYLQVSASNTPARALYRRAGFIAHHRYRYRYAPA